MKPIRMWLSFVTMVVALGVALGPNLYAQLQQSGGPGSTVTIGAALPTGSNVIGKVSIDQTTPGTTNGVQVNAALPAGNNNIGDVDIAFEPHDVFVVPPWTPYQLTSVGECVLLSLSDRAAQETLGFWREQDPSNAPARRA